MPNLTIVKKDAPARITVRPAVADYLAATHRLRVPGSQAGYTWKLHAFANWCDQVAGISLETIDASTISAFLDYYEATGTPRKAGATQVSKVTVAGMVTVIKSFLSWCSRDRAVYADFVAKATVEDIHRPPIPHVIIEIFTQQQIRQLLEACESEENPRMVARGKALIHTLVGTGIRAAECCNLKLADVHLEDGEAWIKIVQGKGARDRICPLGPITRRKLSHYIETWRAGQPQAAPVFTTRDGVEAITPAGIRQLMERLAEQSGVSGPRISPHTLRHTFACNCITSGMDVLTLSRLLGHQNLGMTQNYLKGLPASDIAARALPFLR